VELISTPSAARARGVGYASFVPLYEALRKVLMDPRRLLTRMCTRHGLPTQDGLRLLPLVKKALESPSTVRDKILTLVEANLAGRKQGKSDTSSLFRELDEEVLISVGRLLHDWEPTGHILEMGKLLPGLFPEKLDPETE